MTPEGSRHTTGMDLVADCLRRVLDSGFHVRLQHPLAADDYSEPEPDVAVVTGAIRDYRDAHPTLAVPIVEVSDESLHHDRTVKQRLDTRCGIPEYWILALPDARLEVYRDPAEHENSPPPTRPSDSTTARIWSNKSSLLPQCDQTCNRRQRRAARSPRRTDRRRRSASLTPNSRPACARARCRLCDLVGGCIGKARRADGGLDGDPRHSRAAPTGEHTNPGHAAKIGVDTHHAAQPLERYLNTGAPVTSWCFRLETATNSRSATCCGHPRTTSETRFCTRPHATVGSGHGNDPRSK